MLIDDAILNNELFHCIEKDDVIRMLECMKARRKKFKKGDFIFMAGWSKPEVSILISGRAQIVRENAWGDSMLVGVIEEGDMFGEAFAYMDVKSIPVSAVAAENGEALMLDVKCIHTCENSCEFHQRFVLNLVRIIARKNSMLNQKMFYLNHKTIRGRLTACFSDLIKAQSSFTFELPFNRTELANYLCIDRSAMTRELSNMKREGILDYQGRKIIWLKKDEYMAD